MTRRSYLAGHFSGSTGRLSTLPQRAANMGRGKVREALRRRYACSIVSDGFAKSIRLVAKCLGFLLVLFRKVRMEYVGAFAGLSTVRRRRMVSGRVGLETGMVGKPVLVLRATHVTLLPESMVPQAGDLNRLSAQIRR